MDWSNDMVLEFLELYKQQSIIWDPRNPQHKDKILVLQCWENIRKNFPVCDVTINDLKKKKESLMASYRGLQHRVLEAQKAGAPFKPSWFCYDSMHSFMKDIYVPSRASKVYPSSTIIENDENSLLFVLPKEEEINESDDELFMNPEEENSNTTTSFTRNNTETDQAPTTYIDSSFTKNNSESSTSYTNSKPETIQLRSTSKNDSEINYPVAKRRKLTITTSATSQNSVSNSQNGFSQNNRNYDDNKEQIELYINLLVCKLRELDYRTRLTVMNKIDNLLFEVQMSQLSQQSGQEEDPLAINHT